MKKYLYKFHKDLKSGKSGISGFLMIFAFVLFLMPTRASAVTVSLQKNTSINVRDTALVGIMINTEGEEINAMDGTILIDGPVKIKTITTGGSIFDLWPNKPSFDKNQITFVGGTTAGVSGTSLRLFTIALVPSAVEDLTLTLRDSTAYKNDGKGSKILIPQTALKIQVGAGQNNSTSSSSENSQNAQNSLAALILNDKTPPEHFSVELGRDSDLNDGKYFVTFYATDKESGINRYEVEEGGLTPVRSGSVYVLRDQNLTGTIKVKAIDNAGNERVEKLELSGKKSSGQSSNSPWTTTIIIIVVLILIKFAIRFFKRKNI